MPGRTRQPAGAPNGTGGQFAVEPVSPRTQPTGTSQYLRSAAPDLGDAGQSPIEVMFSALETLGTTAHTQELETVARDNPAAFTATVLRIAREIDDQDGTTLNLTGIDLTGAQVQFPRMDRSTGFKHTIRIDMPNANLTDADISGSWLQYTDLTGVTAVRTNLSQVTAPDARWVGVTFQNVTFVGSVLEGGVFDQSEFIDTDFSSADAHRASFTNVNFVRCAFRHTELYWTTLRNARFTGSDLRTVITSTTDFTDADFRGAHMTGNEFKGTFDRAVLDGVDLTGTTFSE